MTVFSKGVDPGAGGMQVTTDGKRKIIERIDCSGAGDVDMSKEVTRDTDGYIEGVSGRKLKVPDAWNALNATNTYRVGAKRIFDLYPVLPPDQNRPGTPGKALGPSPTRLRQENRH